MRAVSDPSGSVLTERLACLGEAAEKRCWLEPVSVFVVETTHCVVDGFDTDQIGPKHRAPPVARETVPVHPDNVDITGPLSQAFFQNLGSFVDERVEAPFQDVLVCDVSTGNALFS